MVKLRSWSHSWWARAWHLSLFPFPSLSHCPSKKKKQKTKNKTKKNIRELDSNLTLTLTGCVTVGRPLTPLSFIFSSAKKGKIKETLSKLLKFHFPPWCQTHLSSRRGIIAYHCIEGKYKGGSTSYWDSHAASSSCRALFLGIRIELELLAIFTIIE